MNHAPPTATDPHDIEAILARVSHWLPAQGPIKDFIHHNTLHAFQGMAFHQGVAAAARLYGTRGSMPSQFFREAYQAGRISDSALDRALALAFSDSKRRAEVRARLLAATPDLPPFAGWARHGLRAGWTDRLGGVALQKRSHLHLFRLLGAYLDQGLSTWSMPGVEQMGFYDCVVHLVQESLFPLLPFNTAGARALLSLPAREALTGALAKTIGSEEWFETYLLETLLSQPGWSGMVGECERKPGQLLNPRKMTLLDCAAVTLVAELGCLERELGPGFAPLKPSAAAPPGPPDSAPSSDETEELAIVWQEAFEWSYYESLLGALGSNAARSRPAAPISTAWAVFCIDDRTCSVRRHLEEVAPSIATFGTAGFFGLDFFYRGVGDVISGKHCPAPMTPQHLIVEEYELPEQRALDRSVPWWRRALQMEPHSNTFLRGWVLSYALGLGAAVRLAASVFRPSLAPVTVPPLSTVNTGARFRLLREGDAKTEDGLWLGYSCSELADRVASVLRSIGADHRWPELVVLFGHGASSVNNPYFAAYNCGACSGRVGAPNARAFAKAANRAEVRATLKERGLEIPDSTWMVGALYDTTRDEAVYYDLERMPERFVPALKAFRESFEEVLARNAAERCRRFESVPLPIEPASALQEVRQRSVSLFEPRPEYNHATNASAVVGRRALTAGLFLDRRTFLNSYEPAQDPEGQVLTGILSAVIPVCAGINLEYFFSRLDPRVYGAGSKLPHNVNGLLGVCNGIEGDLLTGLPTQMTEIHDPVRLIVIVEQTPDVALQAARRNPSVFEFIDHEWVRYGAIDPTSHQIWMYLGGQMARVDGLSSPRWAWPTSLEAARQSRENLPVGYVGQFDLARRERPA